MKNEKIILRNDPAKKERQSAGIVRKNMILTLLILLLYIMI